MRSLFSLLFFFLALGASVLPRSSRSDEIERLLRRAALLKKPGPSANFSKTSRGFLDGKFTVTYGVQAPDGKVPLGKSHAWIFEVKGSDGLPVSGARIYSAGVMPQMGHDTGTTITVSDEGNGKYLASGYKFGMGGWWTVYLNLKKDGIEDEFFFDFQLPLGSVESGNEKWTREELGILASLSTESLLDLRPSDFPTNRFALHPTAIALGRKVFFDRRLSRDGKVSCGSCHDPKKAYGSSKLFEVPKAGGKRKSPSLVGVARQSWFFWDGRKDSLWSQVLEPFENPLEYHRTPQEIVSGVKRLYPKEWRAFEELFPGADSRTSFVNVGKAVAAFITTLEPTESPFDEYVKTQLGKNPEAKVRGFGECEEAGLRLFVHPKVRCLDCHNGPRLADDDFHATGIFAENGARYYGSALALEDPYNCLGEHSDDRGSCAELKQTRKYHDRQIGAFKTPTLRNLTVTSPYMHGGQLRTLEEVVEHYGKKNGWGTGHVELNEITVNGEDRVGLTIEQRDQLVCFLRSLTSNPVSR